MCKCNHKSREQENGCCCDCHGNSNFKKDCHNKGQNSPVEDQTTGDDQNSYEKRA